MGRRRGGKKDAAGGSAPAEAGARATPMMTQYLQLKEEVGDAILFYRMGDFYEMFFDDAITAAELCDLTLTSRNKSDPEPIPMAGVPWHSAEPHLARLLRAGHRIAICEQVDEPESKGLMKREIVEILSPGTTLTETMLEEGRNSYLVALWPHRGRWGLAVADVSTGEFSVGEVGPGRLAAELEQLLPREILLPGGAELSAGLETYLREHRDVAVERLDAWLFSPSRGRKQLRQQYGVATLEPFGIEGLDRALAAAGALLHYAAEQRRSPLGHLRPPKLRVEDDALLMDEATLANLEVLEPLSGDPRHCLLGVLDMTLTAMGHRALRRSLSRPLVDLDAIRARHDATELLLEDPLGREQLRDELRRVSDLERILARLHAGRSKPSDLFRLRDSLPPMDAILAWAAGREERRRLLPGAQDTGSAGSTPSAGPTASMASTASLRRVLTEALVPDPASAGLTGLIRNGHDPALDEYRGLATEGETWIAALQARERQTTGISTLKVGYNKVFGYYLEVTRPHLARVPDHYERKQTLVGAERFITADLKTWEEKILGAQERAREREAELIEQIKRKVIEHTSDLLALAETMAEWDLVAAFAQRAHESRYVKPEMHEGDELVIRGARHPVVEHFLGTETFVPNDVLADSRGKQILIVTGPNMAGKSTYLRQMGLLVLMAQAGSFVPAEQARIGLADRLFTRVGASDRIARGQSTFLVEMIETARILHEATSRSVVLLDEIGRGTSTFDGLAIAWAVAEYLRARPACRPRTLFATHFHELTELARRHEGYQNLNVVVKEWQDQVIFVRRVEPGSADRSYGIQVARLAGLPEVVLDRARDILSVLEAQGPRNLLAEDAGALLQYSLFGPPAPRRVADRARAEGRPPASTATPTPAGDVARTSETRMTKALEELSLDSMTPRQALEWLYEWKRRLAAPGGPDEQGGTRAGQGAVSDPGQDPDENPNRQPDQLADRHTDQLADQHTDQLPDQHPDQGSG